MQLCKVNICDAQTKAVRKKQNKTYSLTAMTLNKTPVFPVTMRFHKSTLVTRGAEMQLDLSCVSAPLANNVDLFACFVVRLFKSTFSYI